MKLLFLAAALIAPARQSVVLHICLESENHMTDATTSRHYFPSHGSAEMVPRINQFDWEATVLGPIAGWPANLRTALSILLGSRFPMQLLWGLTV